jgi:hypothetical protein
MINCFFSVYRFILAFLANKLIKTRFITKMTLFGLIFMGFMALKPNQALTSCDCGSLSRIVTQSAERVINSLSQAFTMAIKESATYQTQYLHRDLVSIREALLINQQSAERSVKALSREQAAREYAKTYDLGAQPITGCGNQELGASLLISEKSLRGTQEEIENKLWERKDRYARPLDYLTEAQEFKDGKMAGPVLGPSGAKLTYSFDELKQAERLVELMVNPMPILSIPAKDNDSPGAKLWRFKKIVFDSKLSFYQSILAKILASRAPTIEGLSNWAKNKWTSMGAQGEPIALKDGRLSRSSLFWLLTNLRLSSANWHETILPSLPEAGLLRELVSMKAVEIELDRERNEHLENIAATLALMGLDNLERREGAELKQILNKFLSGQVK